MVLLSVLSTRHSIRLARYSHSQVAFLDSVLAASWGLTSSSRWTVVCCDNGILWVPHRIFFSLFLLFFSSSFPERLFAFLSLSTLVLQAEHSAHSLRAAFFLASRSLSTRVLSKPWTVTLGIITPSAHPQYHPYESQQVQARLQAATGVSGASCKTVKQWCTPPLSLWYLTQQKWEIYK